MSIVVSLLLMTFPIAMTFAAANDLFTMKIPNRISAALILAFLAVAALTQMPLDVFGLHVAGAFCVLALTFALFAMNYLGGGDAKLMAAGALWMGSAYIVEYVASVTIFGGVLCLFLLAYRRMVPAEALGFPGWALRLNKEGGPVPYGIAIAAAGLLLFPQTDLFLTWMR
ncbi:peptidase [Hyphomicrobium methylovorum]|uniref:A24 family peptidase n=1 Tax=Hyphomicrobium methylovorum TaxID=84 RepID=UPI0015E7A672|nr:prepilin peptidase [Hyphomicrobium methylovorum]MBA2126638.1 peptidase [Hyphomicrobium methylovorum]